MCYFDRFIDFEKNVNLLILQNIYKIGNKFLIFNINQSNKYIKKGLAITPAKFGISFTTTHLNQGEIGRAHV